MSVLKTVKEGGRKASFTLLAGYAILIAFGMQYVEVYAFMILEGLGVCLDHYWINQLPKMTPTVFVSSIVTLSSAYGAINAYSKKYEQQQQ